jgi:hypothetical protein
VLVAQLAVYLVADLESEWVAIWVEWKDEQMGRGLVAKLADNLDGN